MRIAIGCDDTGFPLKEPLVAALEADGHDVLDLGTFSTDPVDYPDYARAVGQAVLRGFVDASLLLCASGTGGVIAANKMRGIRAAMCHDVDSARRSREEVDANVLCLAAAGLEPKTAIEIAQAFIGTQFQPGDPQSRQVAKIGQLEAGLLGSRQGAAEAGGGQGRPEGHRAPAGAREAGRAQAGSRGHARGVVPAARAPSPHGPRRHGAGAGAAGPAQAARGGGDAALPRGARVPGSPLGEGRHAVEGRRGDRAQPARLAHLAHHHAQPRRGHPHVRRRDPPAAVLPGGPPRHGRLVADRRGPQRDLRLQDGLPGHAHARLHGSGRGQAHRSTPQPGRARSSWSRASPAPPPRRWPRTRSSAARSRPRRRRGPGMQFVAITDPGRPLDKLATETGFRRTFLNPASIGGRFSALSFFGLVPAALIGVDIKILLERAHGMVETCGNEVGVRGNPAVQLGAVLAGLARAGRDKVTLVLSEKIRALGALDRAAPRRVARQGRHRPRAGGGRAARRAERRTATTGSSCPSCSRATPPTTRPSRSSRTPGIPCSGWP